MSDKSVHVADSVDFLLSSVVELVKNIKAGKSLEELIATELPVVIKAVGVVGGVAGDIKNDLKGVINAAGVGMAGLLEVFIE